MCHRQERLFNTAPVAVSITAGWSHGFGWTLHMCSRKDGQDWADARIEHYEGLSTAELLDVLDVTSSNLFSP